MHKREREKKISVKNFGSLNFRNLASTKVTENIDLLKFWYF